MTHELLTIDAAPRALHPVETILVSAAHRRAVEAVRRG